MKHNKLELRWTNKDKSLYYDLETGKYEWVDKRDPRVSEPRILVEKGSFGEKDSENILIKGDNLLALKALYQDYKSKIKVIFIDPPYNTGSAFERYDDGLEHSIWLGMMRPRLELLRELLGNNGSIWISIDDNESHYLKVLCDEVFGRVNFLTNVVWEKSDSPRMDAEFFSGRHDHILVYAKNRATFKINKIVNKEAGLAEHYDKIDKTGRPYYLKPLRAMGSEDTRAARESMFFPLTAPDGSTVLPMRKDGTEGRWRWGKKRVEEDDNLIEWVKGHNGWVPYYRIYGDVESYRPPETIWFHTEVGSNRTSKAEIKAQFGGAKAFDNPKPERLIQRIITLSSNSGDLVLDSFAGSGTTGAVAHKMGRKWIMIELGDNAETLCTPRLKRVISGEDQSSVSKDVGWKGGGGFKYFELEDSLFVRDEDLKMTVINPKMYNGALIQAVLKIEGFKTVNPDNALHGISGTTAAHVTEQYLNQAYLDVLVNEIGDKAEYVVVYAKTISSKLKIPENVEIKRIPGTLLEKFTI